MNKFKGKKKLCDNGKVIGVMFLKEDVKRIEDICKIEGSTISGLIRFIILQWINNYKIE